MRVALLLLVLIFTAILASELQFISVPQSLKLPIPSVASGLRISDLHDLNANLLGLTAKPVHGFEVESDLFVRPMAIAMILVTGVDSLKNAASNLVYTLGNDGIDWSSLDKDLARFFGSDRETVTVTRNGISGSKISLNATEQEIEDSIKTKLPVLREELQHVYRMAAAILVRHSNFEERNVPGSYYVTINGLSSHTGSNNDLETALDDIRRAVQILSETLSTVYSNRAVVEVLTISGGIKSDGILPGHSIIRRKRDIGASETDINLKTWRELLNVYVFVGTDYPAIFAIFAGLTITLTLAVLYTVVGMMSMDPSKDSIIYRMTTTRMKKA